MKKKLEFLVPSLGELLFIAIFLRLTVFKPTLLNDADTGWHIRIGDSILRNFSIPRFDIFSYVTPPLPWITPDWLSELFMALIHRTFGLNGVAISFALIISLLYYLLFRTIRRQRGNIIVDFLIMLIVMVSSMLHWLARPFILSLFLFLTLYYILERFQSNGKNYLYFLPPIMLLWTNLHGAFITGFILIVTYLICNTLIFIFSREAKREEYKRKTKILGLTTLVCILISLINPFGYNVFLYTFKVTSNQYLMDHIIEFLSPNFHHLSVMPFKYLLLIAMLIFALARKELGLHELLLTLLFTAMSLYSARNILFFVIVIAPILSRHSNLIINQLHGKFVGFLKKKAEIISQRNALLKTYIWFFPFIFIISVVIGYKFEINFDEKIHPVTAVNFLRKEFIKGNMFNSYGFGNYIIYSAFPQYKVFIHGKIDWRGVEKLREYYKVALFEPGWEDVIEKYKINWIFFNTDSVLTRFLEERNDWKLIYADKVASIFVRNVPEYFDIIKKYRQPLSPVN